MTHPGEARVAVARADSHGRQLRSSLSRSDRSRSHALNQQPKYPDYSLGAVFRLAFAPTSNASPQRKAIGRVERGSTPPGPVVQRPSHRAPAREYHGRRSLSNVRSPSAARRSGTLGPGRSRPSEEISSRVRSRRTACCETAGCGFGAGLHYRVLGVRVRVLARRTAGQERRVGRSRSAV